MDLTSNSTSMGAESLTFMVRGHRVRIGWPGGTRMEKLSSLQNIDFLKEFIGLVKMDCSPC